MQQLTVGILERDISGDVPENLYGTDYLAVGITNCRDMGFDGQTLAEIIEANGSDVAAVRAALIEAFNALPNADDFDAEQLADQWLGQQ